MLMTQMVCAALAFKLLAMAGTAVLVMEMSIVTMATLIIRAASALVLSGSADMVVLHQSMMGPSDDVVGLGDIRVYERHTLVCQLANVTAMACYGVARPPNLSFLEFLVTVRSTIEITSVPIKAHIGIFSDGSSDPYEHSLDLKLAVDPSLVLIDEDSMQHVFDYDRLLEEIHHISQHQHYETQEMLASLIVRCCAGFSAIESVEVCLKKFRSDGHGGTISGMIGVTLQVQGQALAAMR